MRLTMFMFVLLVGSLQASPVLVSGDEAAALLKTANDELIADRLDVVETYLEQVDDGFVSGHRWEVRRLRAEVAMRTGQYRQAIVALTDWRGQRELVPLMRYNLALSYLHSGQVEEGLNRLEQLGDTRHTESWGQWASDRANLSLGLFHFNAGRPSLARQFLNRVRVDGALANKALLAAAWCDYQVDDLAAATTPLLVLKKRAGDSPERVEGLLLLGEVLARQGNITAALEAFEQAESLAREQDERLQSAAKLSSEHLIQSQRNAPSELLASLDVDWSRIEAMQRSSQAKAISNAGSVIPAPPTSLVNASLTQLSPADRTPAERIKLELDVAIGKRRQQLARWQEQAQFRTALWFDQLVARRREAQ